MYERILAAGVAVIAMLVGALPLAADDGKIMVADPFARETPPNAKVGGAYMTLMNHGAANRLVGARSDVARMVQIHNHTMDASGIMRMREVEGGIALGMHETVVLQPGGLHVMLMGLETSLKKGDTLDLTLDFEDGSTVDVTVPIMSISASGGMKHDHGEKKKHEH